MPTWVPVVGVVTGPLGLFLSGLTLWLTLLRRGSLRMTRPTLIAFALTDDGPKVWLRSLLHSTAKRGNVIENMYVRLSRKETQQNFNIWGYGEGNRIARGSGLYVGQEGIALDHHFLLPVETTFDFLTGTYAVEVFATLVGAQTPVLLHSVSLVLNEEHASGVQSGQAAMFNWGPDSKEYHLHLDERLLRRMTLPRTIDTVVKIDLMATDHPIAIVLDGRVDYYLPIRVLNAGPFPIRIRDLLIRWQARGVGFEHHDSHQVVDEFRWLAPGEEQPHSTMVRGPAFGSATVPPTCRMSFGGVLLAEADAWGGQVRYELNEARYTFGSIVDQRTKKPA